MKDPTFPPRLTEGAGDDFVRGILAAGRRDGAAPAQAQLSIAKYMDGRGQGAVGGALRPATSWFRFSPKLVAPIALVGAISLGWAVHRSTNAARRPPVTAQIVATAAPEPAMPSSVVAAPEAPSVRVDDLPSAGASNSGAVSPASAPRGPASAVVRSAPGSLADELALVEAARASLSRSDVEECLRALDAYDRRFRGGVLAHEVAAMRIEALVAEGQRERARALGDAFLAANPSSPYASRIQSILTAAP